MTFYHESCETVVQELSSDIHSGLSDAQIVKKQEEFGENKLKEKKKKTMLQRFADQFKDAMILILLAAATVSFVIACMEGNPEEFFEPVLILLIVVVNAIMGLSLIHI